MKYIKTVKSWSQTKGSRQSIPEIATYILGKARNACTRSSAISTGLSSRVSIASISSRGGGQAGMIADDAPEALEKFNPAPQDLTGVGLHLILFRTRFGTID